MANSHMKLFFKETSLHGFRCLVEKNRSLIEKIFWVSMLILMSYISGTVIIYLTKLWLDSPTIKLIENTEFPIQDIPFPSITICSPNQLRNSYLELIKNKTFYMEKLQQYNMLLCHSHNYGIKMKDKVLIEYFDQETFKDFQNNCPISCSELFDWSITWRNISLADICHYVQPINTVFGLCYVFNMIPAYEMYNDEYYESYRQYFIKNMTHNNSHTLKWNMDDGYPNTVKEKILLDVVPARIDGVGYNNRLSIMLNFYLNSFKTCGSIFPHGFLIDINNPLDVPGSFGTRTMIRINSHTTIQVTPNVVHISADLRSRSPDVRKCYLNNERKLLIYRQYTWLNCIRECYTNITLIECGCVSLGSIPVPRNVKICGLAKKECMDKSFIHALDINNEKNCNCWPTCTEIQYTIAISSSSNNWSYLKKINLKNNDSMGAIVDIVFKNPHFMAYQAQTIFSLHQYIGAIGGFLGLLLGFNLYGMFEIIYSCILTLKYYFVKYFTK